MQRQLQLRIEAQGKYLQKIIEEQQKLGGVLQASEDKQKPPNSPSTSQDAIRSPNKKARVGDLQLAPTLNGAPPPPPDSKAIQPQWDHDLRARGVGLEHDLPND